MPNASRSQWLSVKPAQATGAGTRAGLDLGDELLDRLPQRRLERRAGAAAALDPLEVVVALPEHRAQLRLDLGLRLAGQQAAVDRRPRRRPGSRCAAREAEIIVGETVSRQQRLEQLGRERDRARARLRATSPALGPRAGEGLR